MACRVLIAEEAFSALDEAVSYIDGVLFEPASAAALLDAFAELIDRISAHPGMYPLCAEERLASMGVRKALVQGYVALYVEDSDQAAVIGFFHQSQDYASLI